MPCTNHRPTNSSVSPVITAPGVGAVITAFQIDSLRTAIQTEIARWALHADYASVTANGNWTLLSGAIAQSVITSDTPTTDVQDLAMQYVGGAGAPGVVPRGSVSNGGPTADVAPALTSYNYLKGDIVTNVNYQQIVDNYNQLKADCICNSDCGCHAVCACNVNCGCNYSDIRLKMEIFYC